MSNENALYADQLFNKFWNDDTLTPDKAEKEAAPVTPAPSATEVVPNTETPASQSENTEKQPSEAVVVETPSTETAQQAPAQATPTTSPEDWLSKVPEELKTHVESLLTQAKEAQVWQQHHQNLASKHRRLHNELNSLKRQVEQTQQQAQKAKNTPGATTTETEIDEVEKQLQEADPVLAKYLATKLSKLESKLEQEARAKAQEVVQPIEQERQEAFYQEQRNILSQTVLNWQEVASSEMFNAWLGSQTPAVQSLYNQYAADNIRLLHLYQNDMEQMFSPSQQQSVPQTQPQQQPPVNPAASRVVETRQKKLETSAPLPQSHVGVTKPAPKTPEQLFEELYNNPDLIAKMLGKT